MTTLAGGVIGSVLTLTIVPHTGYIDGLYSTAEKRCHNFQDKMNNNRLSSG